MRVEETVRIPMRDGITLCGDVYLPDGDGPFPTLVWRSPYPRWYDRRGMTPEFWVDQGYAVAQVSVRGRHGSEGEWYPHWPDVNDGYDTIEWVAAQPWCDGNCGTFGQSAPGATQYLAAMSAPPHLKAVAPFSTSSDFHRCWVYHVGGALEFSWLISYAIYLAYDPAERQGLGEEYVQRMKDYLTPPFADNYIENWSPLTREEYLHLPLIDWADRLKEVAPYLRDWLSNPDDGDYWRETSLRAQPNRVNAPMFHATSWYDAFLPGSLDAFTALREQAPTEELRVAQKILIGPWGHTSYTTPPQYDHPMTRGIDFGSEAALDVRSDLVRWFDHWLKGVNTGVLDEPPIKLFVMGDNKWRTEHEWPLARTRYTPYYLHSDGRANTQHGDGRLSLQPPTVEPPDRYVYDPNDPVPTAGGNNLVIRMGVADQQRVEEREDVLCYTTDILDSDVEVTGPVTCTVYAASSAYDTDFTAKLVDVHSDGFAQNICDGIIRARYRDSGSNPSLLTPGKVYCYTIDLLATSQVFKAGHRIRLEISSSNFRRFDRNPNTGRPIATETETVRARQTILHDARYPSHVTLPIIPR